MVNVKEQILDTLKEIAPGMENRELNDDVLLADLGIDSMKYVELLVLIEERCNIVFDESDLDVDALRNIGDLSALMSKMLAQQAG